MAEIVEHRLNNHIFPKTIPEKRNNRDQKAQLVFGGVFVTAGLLSSGNNFIFLVTAVSCSFLLLVIIQILVRICYLFEEIYHLKSRYDDDFYKMLKEIFAFNNNVLITVVICCACILRNPIENIESLHTNLLPSILIFIGMYLVASVMDLEQSTLHTAKLMDKLNAMDYGAGMAHSFYHGYLKLIMPCTGDERKGLKEEIEVYESNNKVKFGSKKLYIFIPLSAYCPISVIHSSKCMETGGTLNWHIKDRAGVAGREYHNSVYKLIIGKKQEPIYVCAEYATPLLTLHEVMNQNTDESRLYKKYRKEIVTNFYVTLHKIIKNSRDCRDLIELIYYRDVDNNGNPLKPNELDVGLLLLERINQENEDRRE